MSGPDGPPPWTTRGAFPVPHREEKAPAAADPMAAASSGGRALAGGEADTLHSGPGHYFPQIGRGGWAVTLTTQTPPGTERTPPPPRHPNTAAAQKFPRVAVQRTEGLGVSRALWGTRQLAHKQASHKRQHPGRGAGCWGRGHTRHRRAAGNAGFPARPLHSFETHGPALCPQRLWPQRAKLGVWGRRPEPRRVATLSFSEEKTVSGWCIEKG